MRGIGHTLSRHPKVRALLAGAAILAGAFTSAAHGQASGSGNGTGTLTTEGTQADEAALAMPRISRSGAPEVAIPQPLRPSDAAMMRRIFAFQARGDVASAVRSAAVVEDPLLLGSALADRYTSRYYRSSVGELSDWLKRYGDQPEAAAIHALLAVRLPKGAAVPPAPANTALGRTAEPDAAADDIDTQRNDLVRDPGLDRVVAEQALRGNAAAALRAIGRRRGLPPAYASQLRAEVAQVLFTRNDDADALRVARLALGDIEPADQSCLGFYIGGLAAWRLERIEQARGLFEGGANATAASAHLRAASAFWASRAARAMHDAGSTVKWLHVAADERLTVHGLLARRILRLNTGILPTRELLAQADVDAVAATPQGWRAFALLQIGQNGRAEAELRALWPKAAANPVFGRSLVLVASVAGLTDCAAQMASLLQAKDGRQEKDPLRDDELRFPMPRLRPTGGFSIDPTLVYALARVESNFDPAAVSRAGARGLMQIMPATAQYITGNLLYGADRLHEPASNLEIGQRYVAFLARQDGIDNDLLRILASYNSGPGSFMRWVADVRDQGDPLLFIEAIPGAETRAFVQHALMYLWVYAARMHLPAPSLDELAAGEFPRFAPAGARSAPAGIGFTRPSAERRMMPARPRPH